MIPDRTRLKELLAYCRIDNPTSGERRTLEGLYDSAIGYLQAAGISEPEEGTPRRAQFDLCVNYLVLDGFDQRGLTVSGAIVNDNPAFRRLVNQLKLTELPDGGGVSNGEAGGGRRPADEDPGI